MAIETVESNHPARHDTGSASAHPRVPGWGADLEPANRPAVPRERTPPRLENVHWTRPVQQEATVEILRSNERTGQSAVFGTTVPPVGLSGRVRRAAFHYSESDLRHWTLLLVADRINVIEGFGDDLRRGSLPNVLAEAGAGAAWRHDRSGTIRRMATAGLVAAGVGVWLWARAQRRR
jgi:hypothetical protein